MHFWRRNRLGVEVSGGGCQGREGSRTYPGSGALSKLCLGPGFWPENDPKSGRNGPPPLTVSAARGYLPKLVSKPLYLMNWAGSNEADIQAAEPEAREQARLSCTHEDGRRPQDAQPSSQARPRPDRRQGRRQVGSDTQRVGEGLPRASRIRLGSEIRDLLRRGKRERTKHVDVFFEASPVSHARLGLIVPKYGHRIVRRNLVKRRLREIGRRSLLPSLAARGCETDVILRARRSAYDSDFGELERSVLSALEAMCSAES